MSNAPYFTQHYRSTRPYVRAFHEQIDALRARNELAPKAANDAASRAILDSYRAAGIDATAPGFDMRSFTMEAQLALIYGQWVIGGHIVYDFHPTLTEAFLHSKVEDVCINDLNFPFDAVYFHFGSQPSLTLQSGAPICGAYVFFSPGVALRVVLVAPLEPEAPWHQRFQEAYDLRIPSVHFDKPLPQAIAMAIEDDIADLRKAARTIAESRRGGGSVSPAGRPMPEWFTDSGIASVDEFIAAHAAHRDAYLRCFELIANGLCYVTAYREDVRDAWPSNTPEKLRQKADTATPKEAARAASKLSALGFRKVRRVGDAFGAAAQADEGGVTPHMRKAHWRNQAYGPEMKLRRLRWIRQTRVLGGGTSTTERVYEVTPPKS